MVNNKVQTLEKTLKSGFLFISLKLDLNDLKLLTLFGNSSFFF